MQVWENSWLWIGHVALWERVWLLWRWYTAEPWMQAGCSPLHVKMTNFNSWNSNKVVSVFRIYRIGHRKFWFSNISSAVKSSRNLVSSSFSYSSRTSYLSLVFSLLFFLLHICILICLVPSEEIFHHCCKWSCDQKHTASGWKKVIDREKGKMRQTTGGRLPWKPGRHIWWKDGLLVWSNRKNQSTLNDEPAIGQKLSQRCCLRADILSTLKCVWVMWYP